jgi:hypothetical protein
LSDKITERYNEYADFFAAFKEIKATKDCFSIEKMTKSYFDAYQTLIKS